MAQTLEPPNFCILGQLGMGQVSGFLGSGNPSPCGGLWFGIRLSDNFEGYWGIDYYPMPGKEITVPLVPSKDNYFATSMTVLPTDDFAWTVNIRLYPFSKYDRLHQHFNLAPYLVAGGGMDFLVDQDPALQNSNFYSKSFDMLLGVNAGAGIDIPLGDGKQWFLCAEGMDHFIVWQGLTQILSGRVGLKVMLDSAHIDPFRGMF